MSLSGSYKKFKEGRPLTRREAMEAQCFECNGFTAEKKDDCLGASCALYRYSPWFKSAETALLDAPKRLFSGEKGI